MRTVLQRKRFERKGQEKCQYESLPVKRKQPIKVVTNVHRKWCSQSIKSLDFEKLAKYLGIHIRSDGNIILLRRDWEQQLERLKRSHLTHFFEKVHAIRETVCGRIIYQLRLSDHGLEVTRKLDRMIIKTVKEILHLPTWVSTEWMHHRHGGNIPNLMTLAKLSEKKASKKMKKSEDSIAWTIGDRIDPLNRECFERLKMTNINRSKTKDEQRKKSDEQIRKQNNDRAIITMFESKIGRD